jgi:hypothetical protein
MFANKKVLLFSVSPGARGGSGVMDAALIRFPLHGAEILGYFSLPKFQENFNIENGIVNEELKAKFEEVLNDVKEKL